jgi:hypothetical protein
MVAMKERLRKIVEEVGIFHGDKNFCVVYRCPPRDVGIPLGVDLSIAVIAQGEPAEKIIELLEERGPW